jgi:hypothetical protein
LIGELPAQPNESIGVGYRQRPQQYGIDDGKDGCVRAYPERQRQERDSRVTGRPAQQPDRIANIARNDRHHGSSPSLFGEHIGRQLAIAAAQAHGRKRKRGKLGEPVAT